MYKHERRIVIMAAILDHQNHSFPSRCCITHHAFTLASDKSLVGVACPAVFGGKKTVVAISNLRSREAPKSLVKVL